MVVTLIQKLKLTFHRISPLIVYLHVYVPTSAVRCRALVTRERSLIKRAADGRSQCSERRVTSPSRVRWMMMMMMMMMMIMMMMMMIDDYDSS